MGFGALRAQALDLNFLVHGVAATVTRPSHLDTPIETTLIWVTPITEDAPIASGRLARREPRRIAALRIDEVETVPVGTVIIAPPKDGDENQAWRVDGVDRVEADHIRVIVVPDREVLV